MVTANRLPFTCVYVCLLLLACAISVFLSMGAQPGGIGQMNAFLAPIMGPWSYFLEPNGLTLKSCTQGYLASSALLTVCIGVFVPSSYLVRSRILWNISICIGVFSSVVWGFCGIRRVVLDLM